MVMHHMFRHLKNWRTVEASVNYSQNYREVVLRRTSLRQILRAVSHLHAHEITFTHPASRERVALSCPPPRLLRMSDE